MHNPAAEPRVRLIGNHDLEDARGPEAWTAIHWSRNFQFVYANTRFVAIDGASGRRARRHHTARHSRP